MSVPPVEQGMAFTIPVITEAACSTIKQKLLFHQKIKKVLIKP